MIVNTKVSVNIAYNGEQRSTQRQAQHSVQTARTTRVGRSHTMSVQVAPNRAGRRCSQAHRCLQTGVDESSFSSVNAGTLFTNRVGLSYSTTAVSATGKASISALSRMHGPSLSSPTIIAVTPVPASARLYLQCVRQEEG